MAKTKEELEQLKKEYEEISKKLKELTDEELAVITGGTGIYVDPERTSCLWGKPNWYNPIDNEAPQNCGNCIYYHAGICTASKG